MRQTNQARLEAMHMSFEQYLRDESMTPDQYEEKLCLLYTSEWVKPEVVIVWANQPLASNPDGFMGHWLIDLMRMGTKFIVVDPARCV